MDTTLYKAKVKKQPDNITENVQSALSSCPVGAISIIEETK